MALDAILTRIREEAKAKEDSVVAHAEREKDKIVQKARDEAEELYRAELERQKTLCEKYKQKTIANARLESKKKLLKAKRELIDKVFEDVKPRISEKNLKKELITHDKTKELSIDIDFYIGRVRLEYETDIAKILFGI